MKVAIRAHLSGAHDFLADSPANASRGLEHANRISEAKQDFADQTDVDSFVTARGGTAGDWLVLDLGAAGVK